MDRKIASLLGAAAALSVTTGAQAGVPAGETKLGPAASYADLLKPVPNAMAALSEDEAGRAQANPARVQLAQFHHHHHHGFFHHHHHHGFFGGGVVVGPPAVVAPEGCWTYRRVWNGYRWVLRRIW